MKKQAVWALAYLLVLVTGIIMGTATFKSVFPVVMFNFWLDDITYDRHTWGYSLQKGPMNILQHKHLTSPSMPTTNRFISSELLYELCVLPAYERQTADGENDSYSVSPITVTAAIEAAGYWSLTIYDGVGEVAYATDYRKVVGSPLRLRLLRDDLQTIPEYMWQNAPAALSVNLSDNVGLVSVRRTRLGRLSDLRKTLDCGFAEAESNNEEPS